MRSTFFRPKTVQNKENCKQFFKFPYFSYNFCMLKLLQHPDKDLFSHKNRLKRLQMTLHGVKRVKYLTLDGNATMYKTLK